MHSAVWKGACCELVLSVHLGMHSLSRPLSYQRHPNSMPIMVSSAIQLAVGWQRIGKTLADIGWSCWLQICNWAQLALIGTLIGTRLGTGWYRIKNSHSTSVNANWHVPTALALGWPQLTQLCRQRVCTYLIQQHANRLQRDPMHTNTHKHFRSIDRSWHGMHSALGAMALCHHQPPSCPHCCHSMMPK